MNGFAVLIILALAVVAGAEHAAPGALVAATRAASVTLLALDQGLTGRMALASADARELLQ